jgi:hypothetical protein
VLADLLDRRGVALALQVAPDEVEDLLLPPGQVLGPSSKAKFKRN